MAITLSTQLSRRLDLPFSQVDGGRAVMVSLEAGKYYGLTQVGARIWELLVKPKTVAELCSEICSEYDVNRQTCEREVMAFVDKMIANGIVDATGA